DCNIARKRHPFYVDTLRVVCYIDFHRIEKLLAWSIEVEFSWISLRSLITLVRNEITPGLLLRLVEIFQKTRWVESVQRHEAILSLLDKLSSGAVLINSITILFHQHALKASENLQGCLLLVSLTGTLQVGAAEILFSLIQRAS